MNKVCMVLAAIFVLTLVLSGCGGGDGLPFVGAPDGADQPDDDDGLTPTPPDGGDTPTPPPPPGDGDTDDALQPPAPPVF